MRHTRTRFLLLVAVFGVAITAASFNFGGSSQKAYALTNTQVSGTNAKQGITSTSFDGRYVAFLSSDKNLVSGQTDPNFMTDAFLKDMQTNTTTRLSISSAGSFANGDVYWVQLTGNGRYALMESMATNLTSSHPAFSPSNSSVYLRDIKTGTTTLIAPGPNGAGISYHAEAVSEDGRFVYYTIQGGTENGALYVKDMKLNTAERVDVSDNNVSGNGQVNQQFSSTSCDGRFVAFSSSSSNLTGSDTNGHIDVFLVDRMNGHTIKNLTAAGDNDSYSPKISCDGNHVVFATYASNIVSGDSNQEIDLVDYNVAQDTYSLVSLDENGNQYSDVGSSVGTVNFGFTELSVSIDGRYIAFEADKAQSTTPGGGTIATNKILVRDTLAGTTTLVTPNYGSSSQASAPAITADGKTVYYGQANTSLYKAAW